MVSLLLDKDKFASWNLTGQFDNADWEYGDIPFKFCDVVDSEEFQRTNLRQHAIAAKHYARAFENGHAEGPPVAIAIIEFEGKGAEFQRALAADIFWHYPARKGGQWARAGNGAGPLTTSSPRAWPRTSSPKPPRSMLVRNLFFQHRLFGLGHLCEQQDYLDNLVLARFMMT